MIALNHSGHLSPGQCSRISVAGSRSSLAVCFLGGDRSGKAPGKTLRALCVRKRQARSSGRLSPNTTVREF
ncbi:hypothetical protein A0H81_13932 [Grifola frondosa]|uniref:Uncharacterized protein n=1 Tax=Grifola frondosa TaxID=5627 RepID=A0A1C7LQ94_GRIFR|nr:hypothetical protein A0H81_13932 [Grifola frondosa]